MRGLHKDRAAERPRQPPGPTEGTRTVSKIAARSSHFHQPTIYLAYLIYIFLGPGRLPVTVRGKPPS